MTGKIGKSHPQIQSKQRLSPQLRAGGGVTSVGSRVSSAACGEADLSAAPRLHTVCLSEQLPEINPPHTRTGTHARANTLSHTRARTNTHTSCSVGWFVARAGWMCPAPSAVRSPGGALLCREEAARGGREAGT